MSTLNVLLVNNTGLADTDVYISLQNPGNPIDVTVGGTALVFGTYTNSGGTTVTNQLSDSLTLAAINAAGGYTVTTLSSGAFYVSYGAPLTNLAVPPNPVGEGQADYNTPYQYFELTRTGNSGDQGDLTAINVFSAPIGIQSYSGGIGGTLLQSVGFTSSATDIVNAIAAVAGTNSPAAVIPDTTTPIRAVGPTSFGAGTFGPYPSFSAYLTQVNQDGQSTTIDNHNGFPNAAGDTTYDFTLALTATVNSDNSITLAGDITTTVIVNGKTPAPGTTFKNASITIPADQADYVIYSSTLPTGSGVFGPGWADMATYVSTNSIVGNAVETTQNLAIGDITTGFLAGFVDSSVVPPGGLTAFKDLSSTAWWSQSSVLAFSDVQPSNPYYNVYANVIYTASGNTVYGMPYGDRFVNNPVLVNSVQYNLGGTNYDVDTWQVTLGVPIASVSSSSTSPAS